jgi:hypothetical protein
MNAKFLIPLLYHLFCLLRGPVNVFHRSVEAMLYSESLPCSSSFPVRSRNNVPRVRFTLLQRDDYISCYLDCFNTYSAYKEGESGLYSLDIIDMNSIYCFVVHAQGVPGYIYSGDLRKIAQALDSRRCDLRTVGQLPLSHHGLASRFHPLLTSPIA